MRVIKVLATIVALFLCASTLPARAADDPQALLAKHRAFVGWQFGDEAVTSLTMERTITSDKGTITQRAVEHRVGLAYRRDYAATAHAKQAEDSGSVGFTGRVFWGTDPNGFTVPYIGHVAMNYLAIDALFMEGTTELPAVLEPPATIAGKDVAVVRVTMKGAQPIDLYIDRDTGAYARAVIDPAGADETTINIHSYMTIAPGKKFIGAWSYDTSRSIFSYTKATMNAPLSDADFRPPAATATWSFKSDQPIPIRVTPDRIYINASVNGVPGRFIIDTGSAAIALTDAFANRAHVTTIGHGAVFGVGGSAGRLIRKADTVDIGGNVLSNAIVNTINDNLDDKNYGETVDGLLGFDLFAGSIVDMSLSNHTLRIMDPANDAPNTSAGVVVPVDVSGGVPEVPIALDGKVKANALLDTGNPNVVIISKDVRDHGITMLSSHQGGFLGANGIIRGVGGDEYVYCGTLDKIMVGPFVYTGMDVCESSNWGLHEAVIGFDFLKHFDYVFDYPRGEMIMTPIKN